MHRILREAMKDQVAATAIEYGLIAASVAVVLIAVTRTLGNNLRATFQTVANAV